MSLLGVKLQLPLAPTVRLPSTPFSSLTVTTLPTFAVPVSVGLVSSVTPFCATEPVTLPTSSCRPVSCTWPGTTSTLKIRCCPLSLVLPAGSVTVVVRSCGPLFNGVLGVKLQLPWSFTNAVPITSSLSHTVTTLFGSALPLRVGVLSSVVSSVLIGPVTLPTSSVTTRSVTSAGALVSTMMSKIPVGLLVTPISSVTVAVRLWLPSINAVSGVKLQLPLFSTFTLPMTSPSSYTFTMPPATAVPFSVGVLSSVTLPFCSGSVTGPTLSSTDVITGGTGAPVLMVMLYSGDATVVLPTASLSFAVNSARPSTSSAVGFIDQERSSCTIAVPIISVPRYTVMMLPFSAPVPLMVGRASSVVVPGATLPVLPPT
ncbi:hypothetical protein SRDD_07280 [Serratia sp. DD3]|nr:hypothetical protein SRDD_07280 [Serratia sp. DD3]